MFFFSSGRTEQTVFAPVDSIPGFAVFVQCRGSNAINTDPFPIASMVALLFLATIYQ